ncbi:GIY-YIG nuclease family protein [Vibrio sonorensis]|uniref:GIY-YIG nuclease family protein n=1 Tax=Vibrio sonorensis TaxID=1004316 RepID=UPI0008DA69EC|nr:GIY-YIG nuclease family protein [Vibrio sonorensis]
MIRSFNGALYCGITTDVERRFQQHVKGTGAKALRGKGPLTLVWFQSAGSTRSEATKLEIKLKKLSKASKEKLVSGQYSLEKLTTPNNS